MDPKIFEYYNQNSIRKYPLAETANIESSSGVELPSNLFVDAVYYSNTMQVGISTIKIDSDSVLTIQLTDNAICMVNIGSYALYNSVPIYMNDIDRGFFVLGEGIRQANDLFGTSATFTDCWLENSVVILLPQIITSLAILDKENVLKGNVGLLGTSGIQLTTIDNAIEISAVYERPECQPTGDYLKTLNGLSPDSNGNLVIEGKNLISVDNTENGIVYQTLLTPDKLCPVRFEDGTQGDDGPDGPAGPAGPMGDCQKITPICCECEVCDVIENCAICERCNRCENCNFCEREAPVCYVEYSCYPCDQEICSYQESIPDLCDFSHIDEWPETYAITSGAIVRDHLFLAPPARTQFYYFDYTREEFFAKFTTVGDALSKSNDYAFRFSGYTISIGGGPFNDFVFYAVKYKGDLPDANDHAFCTPYPYSEDLFSYYCDNYGKRILIYSDWVVPNGRYVFYKQAYVIWEDGTIGKLNCTTPQCKILDITNECKSNVFNITVKPYEYGKTTSSSANSTFETFYLKYLLNNIDVFTLLCGEIFSSNSWVETPSGTTVHKWITPLCGPTTSIEIAQSYMIIYKDLCPFIGHGDTHIGDKSIYAVAPVTTYNYHANTKLKEVALSEINTPASKTDLRKFKTSYFTYYYPYDAMFVSFKEKIKEGLYIERLHRLCEAYGNIGTWGGYSVIYTENPIPTIKQKEFYFDTYGLNTYTEEKITGQYEKTVQYRILCKTGSYDASGNNKIKLYSSLVSENSNPDSALLGETNKPVEYYSYNSFYSDIIRMYYLKEHLPCHLSTDKNSYYTNNFNIYSPIATNESDVRLYYGIEQTTSSYSMSSVKLKYLLNQLSQYGYTGWRFIAHVHRTFIGWNSLHCIINIFTKKFNNNINHYLFGFNDSASNWELKLYNSELETKLTHQVLISTTPVCVLNGAPITQSTSDNYSQGIPNVYQNYSFSGYSLYMFFTLQDGWILSIYNLTTYKRWIYTSQIRTLLPIGIYTWSEYATDETSPVLGLNNIEIVETPFTTDNIITKSLQKVNEFPVFDSTARTNYQIPADVKLLQCDNLTPIVKTFKKSCFRINETYNSKTRNNHIWEYYLLTQPNDYRFQAGDPNNFLTSTTIPINVSGWPDTHSEYEAIQDRVNITCPGYFDLNNNLNYIFTVQGYNLLEFGAAVYPLNSTVTEAGNKIYSKLVFTSANINPSNVYKIRYWNSYNNTTKEYSGLVTENTDVEFGGFVPGTGNYCAYLHVYTGRTGCPNKSMYYGTLDTRIKQYKYFEIVDMSDTNKRSYPYGNIAGTAIAQDMFLEWPILNGSGIWHPHAYSDGTNIHVYIDSSVWGFNDESSLWEAYGGFLDPTELPWPHTTYRITCSSVSYLGSGTHAGGEVLVPLSSSAWPGSSPGWFNNGIFLVRDYGYNTTTKRDASPGFTGFALI